MNHPFKTLQELAEEGATDAQGSSQDDGGPRGERDPKGGSDHDEADDFQSLRSMYYSAQEGTIGSRTSSLNTVQFEGIKTAGDCHEDDPYGPRPPSLGELSLSEGDPVPEKSKRPDLEREHGEESDCSILIQAVGVDTSSPEQVTSPLMVPLSAQDKGGPRRLLSEAESLHMSISDTSADGGEGAMTEARADGGGSAAGAADVWVAPAGVTGGCDPEEVTPPADKLPRCNSRDRDLEQEIAAQRKWIVELEGLVERYRSQVFTLAQDLELARRGQADLTDDEDGEIGEDGEDGEIGEDGEDGENGENGEIGRARRPARHRQQRPSLDQSEEECVIGHDRDEAGEQDDGVVGDDRSDLDDGVVDELDLVIEQLQEENRYLKVVYTERISHLVGENRVLRDQLLEAEQQLQELDDHLHEERKPALAISVDFEGPRDHPDHRNHLNSLVLSNHSPKPTSGDLILPADNHPKAAESATIGYSPLGAARLLYF